MPASLLRDLAMSAIVLLFATAGVAAIWGVLALSLRSTCGWMALFAAIDVALLLRLAGIRPGIVRAGTALLGTSTTLLAAGFVVAAARIGSVFGTLPHEAIWRIGPELAATWWRLNVSAWDLVAIALAFPLAWALAR